VWKLGGVCSSGSPTHGYMAEQGMELLVRALQKGGYEGHLMLQYLIPGLGCNNASRFRQSQGDTGVQKGKQGGADRGRRSTRGKSRRGEQDVEEVGVRRKRRPTEGEEGEGKWSRQEGSGQGQSV
jgi:hypothetical protein